MIHRAERVSHVYHDRNIMACLGFNWDSGALIGICKVTKPWLTLNYGTQAAKRAHSGDLQSLQSVPFINLNKFQGPSKNQWQLQNVKGSEEDTRLLSLKNCSKCWHNYSN